MPSWHAAQKLTRAELVWQVALSSWHDAVKEMARQWVPPEGRAPP